MSEAPALFDARARRLNRERAAAGLAGHDFLIREVAEILADRLDDVRRDFPLALDLGCRTGQMAGILAGRGGIRTLIQCDPSPAMLARATGPRLAAEEGLLPCADGAFDLVLSCLALHWVDDLVGALVQIRRALKPDGLFVGALFGAGTLAELRQAFAEAEASRPEARIAPFAEIRDAGGLLARAGFQLPVADRDRLAVSYSDSWALMRDLRGMGEGNALTGRRRHFSRRGVFRAVAEHYRRAHGNADARIPASFEIVVLTGWAPGAGQPKPLAPGSAARRLSDALGGGGD